MTKDEWCDLCGDKLKFKSIKVESTNRVYEVCGHCAELSVGMEEENESI